MSANLTPVYSKKNAIRPRRKVKKQKIVFENNVPKPSLIELEYIPEVPSFNISTDADPAITHFQHVFDHFRYDPSLKEIELDAQKTIEELFPDLNQPIMDEAESEISQIPLSKKKAKKLNRVPLAYLKNLFKRPEIIEWVDVTAPDPILLVTLKSLRNTVSVPQHWQQKRKYLAGKRGFVKPPFDLPPFIKALGIVDLKASTASQEASKSLKIKTRQRLIPKLGKISIDYERMHDAFFKHQTKPPMTKFGDLYYEGKEFECKSSNFIPGQYSDELRTALAMPHPCGPPWIVNMQRYGPPPKYPHLKVPGVNAPIPVGGQWGYQQGGWGKAPVDEFNRPLFGDVFGLQTPSVTKPELPIDRTYWGRLEIETLPEVYVEDTADDNLLDLPPDNIIPKTEKFVHLPQPPSSKITNVSELLTGVISPLSGLETLDLSESRSHKSTEEEFSSVQKPLFSILPTKEEDLSTTTGVLPSKITYSISKPSNIQNVTHEVKETHALVEEDIARPDSISKKLKFSELEMKSKESKKASFKF